MKKVIFQSFGTICLTFFARRTLNNKCIGNPINFFRKIRGPTLNGTLIVQINSYAHLLWRACALDVGIMISDSIPLFGSYDRAFTNPGSITYLIPGIVTDVSAMFVANIT